MGRPRSTPQPVSDQMRLRSGAEPWTIRQLRSLRPGQAYQFYTGTDVDYECADVPLTTDLLHSIFGVARELEERGEIAIRKVKVATRDLEKNCAAIYEFTAIGLPLISAVVEPRAEHVQ